VWLADWLAVRSVRRRQVLKYRGVYVHRLSDWKILGAGAL
jgi:hypothetical protein